MLNGKPFVWILDDEWTDHSMELAIYEQNGFNVKITRSENLTEDIEKYASHADGVVAQIGFPCGSELIERLDNCKIIAISGVGYNHVDIEAASTRGIYVANVPDYCVEEVSDHTVALMLFLTRRLGMYREKVRQGGWDPLDIPTIHRLQEQTIGLLGFGRIARRVAEKVKPFGARIIAHDGYVDDDVVKQRGVHPVSLEELLEQSNILSLHVPLTEETKNLLNRERLSKLPQGAYIVNTCRGGIIDERALQAAIEEGHIAGAGLDVLTVEPPSPDHPLFRMEEVIVTPHSSYISEEAVAELKRRTCETVIKGVQGKVPYALNKEKIG